MAEHRFAAFTAILDAQPQLWAKVSGADRLSVTGAPYDDFVGVVRPLVERFPERVLWGTDWPHPNKGPTSPIGSENERRIDDDRTVTVLFSVEEILIRAAPGFG